MIRTTESTLVRKLTSNPALVDYEYAVPDMFVQTALKLAEGQPDSFVRRHAMLAVETTVRPMALEVQNEKMLAKQPQKKIEELMSLGMTRLDKFCTDLMGAILKCSRQERAAAAAMKYEHAPHAMQSVSGYRPPPYRGGEGGRGQFASQKACNFFKGGNGVCPYGNTCRFSHKVEAANEAAHVPK